MKDYIPTLGSCNSWGKMNRSIQPATRAGSRAVWSSNAFSPRGLISRNEFRMTHFFDRTPGKEFLGNRQILSYRRLVERFSLIQRLATPCNSKFFQKDT